LRGSQGYLGNKGRRNKVKKSQGLGNKETDNLWGGGQRNKGNISKGTREYKAPTGDSRSISEKQPELCLRPNGTRMRVQARELTVKRPWLAVLNAFPTLSCILLKLKHSWNTQPLFGPYFGNRELETHTQRVEVQSELPNAVSECCF
jgi:hypothetical protein